MITLSKEMETGIDKIDEQHRELIARINAVTAMGTYSVSKEETQKTIDLLGEYIVKHFSEEESLHQQSGYSKLKMHRELHQTYIKEFQMLKKEFIANGPSTRFTLSLNNSIINWIVRHIKSADVEFGKYYRGQRAINF